MRAGHHIPAEAADAHCLVAALKFRGVRSVDRIGADNLNEARRRHGFGNDEA